MTVRALITPSRETNHISGPSVDSIERAHSTFVIAMTRKDESMDWNQIETKWAVMARRIRADVQCGKMDDSVLVLRRVSKAEPGASIIVEQSVAATTTITPKRETVSTR